MLNFILLFKDLLMIKEEIKIKIFHLNKFLPHIQI
jgi:hypothetical protein